MTVEIVEGAADPSWNSRTWSAIDDGRDVGEVTVWVRPDGRAFILGGSARPEVRRRLLAEIEKTGYAELYINANPRDEDLQADLRELGFEVTREERVFTIPVPEAVAGLSSAPVPESIEFISAADADEDRLRLLDDLLRDDVPGTAGWRWSPEAFHDETFGPQFDPALYVVAVDAGEYVGLSRIWNSARPRWGMVGVARSHRRRGLAAAMAREVFGVLHAREVPEVTTEVDVDNAASNALVGRMGGRATGSTVEMRKQLRPT